MALEVTSLLASVFEDVKLCMVGPDKDGSKEECELISKETGIFDKIKFTGKLSKREWATLAIDYDIFINTTDFDNMPLSVIEAHTLGLPVISTNVGGIPYLIDDSTGYIVEKNDAEAMADAVIDIIRNPERAMRKVKAARSKAELFDSKSVIKEWEKVLNGSF